jgi:hypothetical protein
MFSSTDWFRESEGQAGRFCDSSDSYGGDYEEDSLLGYSAV